PDHDVPPLHVRVMGVTVAIDCPDEETRDRLARQWSRALVPVEAGPALRTVHAQAGADELIHAHDYALTTEVTLAALLLTAGERFNLHAGGLADADGRVLALVAPSGTGKTTATRVLAEHLDYLSDETVSLSRDGAVLPHAKPLSVFADATKAGPKLQLSPDDLGLLPTPESGRLGRVVVLHRGRPGTRGLVRLDTLEGLLELIAQSSSLGDVPDPLRSLHRLVGSVGGVFALEYDEIADHVDDLVALLADEVPPVTGPEPVSHPGTRYSGNFVEQAVEPGLVARSEWVDAVELEEDVLVLRHGRAIRLENLMATVWLGLEDPRTPEELVSVAEAAHGDHPEAADLVERAIDLLTEEGLVVRGPVT
ncbi:MAG: hypothetical protein ABIO16_06660, partial [Nocardioides sp.]